MLAVTPEGRGQIFAHALYQPQELEKVYREAGRGGVSSGAETTRTAVPISTNNIAGRGAVESHAQAVAGTSQVADLQAVLDGMQQQMQAFQDHVQRLTETVQKLEADLQQLRNELGA